MAAYMRINRHESDMAASAWPLAIPSIVYAFQLIRAKKVRIDIEVKRSEEKWHGVKRYDMKWSEMTWRDDLWRFACGDVFLREPPLSVQLNLYMRLSSCLSSSNYNHHNNNYHHYNYNHHNYHDRWVQRRGTKGQMWDTGTGWRVGVKGRDQGCDRVSWFQVVSHLKKVILFQIYSQNSQYGGISYSNIFVPIF